MVMIVLNILTSQDCFKSVDPAAKMVELETSLRVRRGKRGEERGREDERERENIEK